MANFIINIMGSIGTSIGWLIPVLFGNLTWIQTRIVKYATFETQDFFALDAAIFWFTALMMVIVLGLYLKFVHEVPTGKKFWHISPRPIQIDIHSRKVIQNPSVEKNTDSKQIALKKKEGNGILKEISGVFRASEKSSAFMFLTLFFWAAAGDAFNTNLSLWGPEYALMSDSALALMNIIMGALVAILGYIGARMSQSKGRLWTIRTGLNMMFFAFLGIIICQEISRAGYSIIGFIGISIFMGIHSAGSAIIAIAAITVTWQLAPQEKIGIYTGLYYVFKQAGSILAPVFIGQILAWTTPILGSTGIWVLLVPYCLFLTLCAIITFRFVKKGEVGDHLTEETIEQLKEKYQVDDD
jgi:MFS family permease